MGVLMGFVKIVHGCKVGLKDAVMAGINPDKSLDYQIASQGDIPPIFDEIRTGLETDLESKLRRIDFININCPDLNYQVLILRRLFPEKTWEILAE